MLGDIGPLEIGIVLIIALLVFGPKRLPELGSGLGRGMREFKDGVTGAVGAGQKDEPGEADEATIASGTVASQASSADTTPVASHTD